MKKWCFALLFLCVLLFAGCKDNTPPDDNDDDDDDQDPVEVFYDLEISLPSTEQLEDATEVSVVADAPELLILEVVLDTYYYYHYETMSGFEYIKVFNNTNSAYNLKNHRIVLCNTMQGQNTENVAVKVGNEVLCTGFLFMGLIDEDFIIPSLQTALIWLKPYYWTAGCGSDAFNKTFSSMLVHKDSDQKGAFSQTIADFKAFWHLSESVSVYELTNMGLVGIRPEGGTSDYYPIYTPAAGTMYTHLNSTLLRSLEIQKFNDQEGAATITLLNKYSALPEEKQANPDFIYGKRCFNVMEIRENGDLVDAYYYENCWEYFDPVVRINFCGRVNPTAMTAGQSYVDFSSTSNPGVYGWDNTVGLQFRPPLAGERIMQWQLPLRELSKYQTYMLPTQLAVMRFANKNETTYRFIDKIIKLKVDPTQGLEKINWRTDEVESPGRLSSAAPDKIKVINITRP
jgi:hypothetical protein